ncbi:Tetrapyrrole (Corrin/Porphyrin) methylase family protein [Granulibacter bethesdensis]|uniref:Ribosomal RNA small subunit methyltransferase I n=2 Tax=Granulibacter bethesdensis TaxID=364410 RepID=A0AAN0RG09_9PROT|nr:Tetrapyrrole (Corrin/Porphyrin) methylase family protein [Granulibacter bethesdensis]
MPDWLRGETMSDAACDPLSTGASLPDAHTRQANAENPAIVAQPARTTEQDDPGEQTRALPAGLAPSGLVLVSTPIGNLQDLSARGIETLRHADMILCEDTRTTTRLCTAFGINRRLEALHEHNEEARIPALLGLMRAGKRLALVSDAGTPLVSDPGFRLVRAAIAEGLPVTGIPGANAALLALTLSGLPPHPFLFLGFPASKEAARRTGFTILRAAEAAGLNATMIWHEAPHRLAACLHDMLAVFGDRPAAVARELTKRFEEVRRGSLSDLVQHYQTSEARGEITVLLGPAPAEQATAQDLDTALLQALETHSVKDAAALVATAIAMPRKQVYARALQLQQRLK